MKARWTDRTNGQILPSPRRIHDDLSKPCLPFLRTTRVVRDNPCREIRAAKTIARGPKSREGSGASRFGRWTRPGIAVGLALALVGVAVAVTMSLAGRDGSTNTVAERLAHENRSFVTNDPITRGCGLDKDYLVRIWRGHDPVHSEDITTVPNFPNYSGSFRVAAHSGPWKYVQNVPLVLYGPRRIEARGRLDSFASVTDIFPTIGELTGVEVPQREGRSLTEAIKPNVPGAPKLIVVVVWDAAGRDVLQRWPDRWPNLARMERKGTSYLPATVGSSPSITPATHSNIGTGAFPREHGITAISYRKKNGAVRGSFSKRDPSGLRLTTFGDEIDPVFDNESRVGLVAWKSWHLGMFGHGSEVSGGDRDQLALIGEGGQISGNPKYYSTPKYMTSSRDLARRMREVDASDGTTDGKWLRDPIRGRHDNPSWVYYESDRTLSMLRRQGYGTDAVPDILTTNYKMTDIVQHQFTMGSPETAGVLKAQDRALGSIVDYLNRKVRDYVVIVTADHGFPRPAGATGAWPIQQGELQSDVDTHFGMPKGQLSLIRQTSAVGPFLNRSVMADRGLDEYDIARFLNAYTIRDNWRQPDLPAGYEDRGEEPVFAAAFPGKKLEAIIRCAFGSARPPADAKA